MIKLLILINWKNFWITDFWRISWYV